MKISISFIRHAFLAIGLVLATASTIAQDLKIGYVNVDRILSESPFAKAADARLKQEFSKRERDLETLANQFKANVEKLEREFPTLSESQRAARQRQLADAERDLQRRKRELQEDATLRSTEERNVVLERANRAIFQIAESEKYDIIFQEVVYVLPKHNITDKVIAAMGTGR